MEIITYIDKILLTTHVIAGFISLVLFWLPIVLKKGSKLHIKIGWIYVYTMWFVVISSGLLSIINVIEGAYYVSLFLGFLAAITAMPLWYGISVLKYKKQAPPREFYNRRRCLALGIVILGTINVAYALVNQFADGTILLFLFGLLGMTDIKKVLTSYDRYLETIDPLAEHIAGMLITGIAAYTAFFAFGGRTWLGEMFSGQLMIVPWVMPTVLGVIAFKWYTNKWTKKPQKAS